MKKATTSFYCQHCGTQYAKWQGKCTACGAWNTIVEHMATTPYPSASWRITDATSAVPAKHPKLMQDINYQTQPRISCPDKEFDRVLGGGIVPGSLVLIGGEPGIGKSTLLLQIARTLPLKSILYVSGEESEVQIKMRAARMGCTPKNIYILNETSLQNIFRQVHQLQPELLIVDSIQTLHGDHLASAAGSVLQIKDCTAQLLHYAKTTNTPVFLIGHITKEGHLAGPKVLEHMVDTVLQFEGDRHSSYRIVRTIKNRFGATSELGIYEMWHQGLREVNNPSELLIAHREHELSGVAIGTSLEGNRSLLVELQALVTPTTYGTAQRSTTGFDAKRLNMLLAVLEKKGELPLSTKDVFLNVAGGIHVGDPALDLAVCMALASSLKNKPLSQHYCFAAEVGLGGEVRSVSHIEQRVAEANRLGFKTIFISSHNVQGLPKQNLKITIEPVRNFKEVVDALW